MHMLFHRFGFVSRAMFALVSASLAALAYAGWQYLAREPHGISLRTEERVDTPRTEPTVEFKGFGDSGRAMQAVRIAVENDLFSVYRSRSERSMLPEQQERLLQNDPDSYDPATVPVAPMVVVHGTATTRGGGGMAALQVGGMPVRVVRIGESIAGFRLASIQTGEVLMEREDSTIVVRIESPER